MALGGLVVKELLAEKMDLSFWDRFCQKSGFSALTPAHVGYHSSCMGSKTSLRREIIKQPTHHIPEF